MGFSDFLGNEKIVAALRGALRSGRVPHALLFTGPRGVGKYTLARMFAQAANCERLTDDFCGECATCRRVALLAEPQKLIEQGLAERGESADAATVERIPLILQTHPDVWALVPDPVRLKSPVARPVLHRTTTRGAKGCVFSTGGPPPSVHTGRRGNNALGRGQRFPEDSGGAAGFGDADPDGDFAIQPVADDRFALHAVSFCAATASRGGEYPESTQPA